MKIKKYCLVILKLIYIFLKYLLYLLYIFYNFYNKNIFIKKIY